jgi:tetratricopeptide (TPR) repeat protein
MEPGLSAKNELQPETPLKGWRTITPRVPDHELLRRIGEGSYGEVWLARNLVGTLRAVKVVYRDRFKDERPYEREFSGIQKYEPISRSNEGLVDVLQIGRNDAEHYFYYVMELADNAATDDPREPLPAGNPSVESYVPKTLAQQIRARGRLSVQECITLGLNLNLALGHLHRNGLIHRDVKPSNIIFVNGVPKLADIGLVTEMAEAQSFVGTEGFIPPEGPNSPRADIYALGKVLYEASMAKDRREFPEPYSDLGTDSESHALMELNSVLLKACAPNPKQRYQSAEEMNADLALLNSGKSVQQKQMLERRLKIATRTGIALAAVLVLGAVPYYLAISQTLAAKRSAKSEAEQHQIAEANQRKAEAEAAKSKQVAKLLSDMLEGVGPSVAKGRDITILKEILDKTSESIGRSLTNQPETEIEIRRILSQVYFDLGLFHDSEMMSRAAVELGLTRLSEHHRETAAALNQLGLALELQGKLDEAEKCIRRAIALEEGGGHSKAEIAIQRTNLGRVLLDQGKFEEAETTQREAVTMMRSILATNDPSLGAGLDNLAEALHRRGKLREAESTLRESLAIEQQHDQDSIDVAHTLCSLGNVLNDENQLEEALSASREALEIYRKVGAPPDLITTALMAVAGGVRLQGKNDEAESLVREALKLQMEQSTNASVDASLMLSFLAVLLNDNPERLGEAETAIRQALAMNEALMGAENPHRAVQLNNLASILRDEGKLDEAVDTLQRAVNMKLKTVGAQDVDIHTMLKNLGILLRQQGKLDEAEARLREALELCKSQLDKDHPQLLTSKGELGLVLLLEGGAKLPEAERLFREALDVRERKSPDAWGTFYTRNLLGGCLTGLRKFDDAEPLLVSGYDGMKQREKQILAADKSRLHEAGERVVRLYDAWGKPSQAAEWRSKLSSAALDNTNSRASSPSANGPTSPSSR